MLPNDIHVDEYMGKSVKYLLGLEMGLYMYMYHNIYSSRLTFFRIHVYLRKTVFSCNFKLITDARLTTKSVFTITHNVHYAATPVLHEY